MKQKLGPAVAKVLNRLHYAHRRDADLRVAGTLRMLSLRHLEGMMAGRGISVAHSIVYR